MEGDCVGGVACFRTLAVDLQSCVLVSEIRVKLTMTVLKNTTGRGEGRKG